MRHDPCEQHDHLDDVLPLVHSSRCQHQYPVRVRTAHSNTTLGQMALILTADNPHDPSLDSKSSRLAKHTEAHR